MRGEFDLISAYFAPLARGHAGSLGLRDDAAVLPPTPGRDTVLTTDALVAGVHYLPDDPPASVGQKLLRVNLSDLAAMGAQPLGYLLTLVLSRDTEEAWVSSLSQGLSIDQERYGIALLGGDTTAGPGPTMLSLTALGTVAQGRALRRDGAAAGEGIYVSGTIGDAALGLQVRSGHRAAAEEADAHYLVGRYRRPEPRLALGAALRERRLASAVIDVSDGLVADLGHVCAASGLGAEVAAADVPLSPAVQRLAERDRGVGTTALTGGDDYELLFTVPESRAAEVAELARDLDLPLTRIGHMATGHGVTVLGSDGRPLHLDHGGWTHF